MVESIGEAAQIGGGAASIATILWWVVRGAHRRIDKAERDIADTRLDLANHKIYSEGAFVKGSSLDRVHDRIDAVASKQDEILKLLIERGR